MNDPIAIVGISCRVPGASGPDEFWSLLRDGTESIGEAAGARPGHRPRRLPRRRRGLRRRLLRDLPARGGGDGSAAAARARARLGRPGGRGARTPSAARWACSSGVMGSDYGHVLGRVRRREPSHDARPGPRADRQPGVLRARPRRSEPDRRHRAVLVAGGRAPRLPEPARERVRGRARGRREPDPLAALEPRDDRVRRALARRPLLRVGRARQRARPRRGRRHRRAQAPAGRAGRGRPHLRRDPRQRAVDRQRRERARRCPAPKRSAPRSRPRSHAHACCRTRCSTSNCTAPGRPWATRSRPARSPRPTVASRAERLAVGSVKTNLGHLEGAAGITGLIKTALCVYHGQLVASLNFERPNPDIELDALRVAQATEAWAGATAPRRRLLVRHGRRELPRRARAAAGRRGARAGRRGRCRCCCPRTTGPRWSTRRRGLRDVRGRARAGARGPRLLARQRARAAGRARGGRGRRRRGPAQRPGRARRGHAGRAGAAGDGTRRTRGVRVPRPGLAVGGHGRRAAGHLARVRGVDRGLRGGAGAARRLVAARCADRPRAGAGARRRRAARAVGRDGLAGRAVARARGRAGRGDRAFAGRDRGRLRRRRAVALRRRARGRAAQPGDRRRARGPGRDGLDRARRRDAAGSAPRGPVGRRRQRPAQRRRGRRGRGARRAARDARGRGRVGAPRPGRLPLALARGRTARAAAARRPRPDHAGHERGRVLLDARGRADRHRHARRELLVPQPAQPGALRSDDRAPARRRRGPVRRAQPAPGPGHRGHRHDRAGRRRCCRDRHAAPRRRLPRALHLRAGQRARPRRAGRLGHGVRRRAPDQRPALRLPADAPLAGGRKRCHRRPAGRGSGAGRAPVAGGDRAARPRAADAVHRPAHRRARRSSVARWCQGLPWPSWRCTPARRSGRGRSKRSPSTPRSACPPTSRWPSATATRRPARRRRPRPRGRWPVAQPRRGRPERRSRA